jgi:hypothetical protein
VPRRRHHLSVASAATATATITIATLPSSSLGACCDACQGHTTCAVFVLGMDKTWALLSANPGGAAATGVTSGTPKR